MVVSLICFRRADHNPFARFLAQALERVEQESLHPVSSQELFDGAMEGIVGQLDEYSGYISAQDTAEFEADLTQEFGGVGVLIRLEPISDAVGAGKVLTVINPPMFGTPAQKVGLEVRDRILEINGKPTVNMTMDDVLNEMRGPVGAVVELLVDRDSLEDPQAYEIVREIINVPSVVGDRPRGDGNWEFAVKRDSRIAHIRVLSFGEKTSDEVRLAFQQVRDEGLQAIVLDLRDNPGGLLDAAVEISDMLLPAGSTIVSVRGRGDVHKRSYISTGDGEFQDIPIVVLVNRYSASASEIVAACLQDNGRAAIAGQRSWGKGTIQHVIPIQGGKARLRLTAARYVRPNNTNIHRDKEASEEDAWGVSPEARLRVRLTDREMARVRRWREEQDIISSENAKPPEPETYDGQPPEPDPTEPADPQLERALEELQQVLGGRGDYE